MPTRTRTKTKTTTPGVYKVETVTKDGTRTRYEVLHRINGRLVNEGTYPAYADACAVLRRVRASVDDATYVPRRSGEATFGQVADQWLAKKAARKPRTVVGYRALLSGRLAAFHDVPIKRMTYDRVSTFVAAMQAEGKAASTVRNNFNVIKGVMDEAVKQRLVKTNPCHDVEKPAVQMGETYELQVEEVERLILEAHRVEPRWGLLIATAAYSGLRAGELAALKVRRVNFAAGSIDVRESLTFGLDGKHLVTAPKSRAGRRTVRELPPSLTTALARYVDDAGLSLDDYLFGWRNAAGESQPYRHTNFHRRVFTPAARAAGLPVDKRPGEPVVRPHDLRHFHAAMLLADPETTLKDAQAQMGHTTLALLADRYAHLLATSGKGRATRMDAARVAAQRQAVAAVSGANVTALPQRDAG